MLALRTCLWMVATCASMVMLGWTKLILSAKADNQGSALLCCQDAIKKMVTY